MQEDDLKIRISNQPAGVVVKLIGEARIGMEDAETELSGVVAQKPSTVIIDATDLTFLASVGMRMLVNLQRAIVSYGGTVKLAGLRPPIQTALRHAHLLDLFDLRPDLPSALG